jgi:thiol-disulfide isomerase/thioredoxin
MPELRQAKSLNFYRSIVFDTSGNKINETAFKTNTTIIDFWFGECPPCIAEMKKFQTLLRGNENKVSIVSVSIDDLKTWKRLFHSDNPRYDFLKKSIKGWTHAILIPPTDSFVNAPGYIISNFSTNTFPCYFVLDKKGIIKDSPVSAVDFIKTNFNGEAAYFVYLENKIKENGFFYLFLATLIFYSGIFWITILLAHIFKRRLKIK